MKRKLDFKALDIRRLQGVMLLARGLTQSEVARQLGVTRQAVACWKQRMAAGGKESLLHQKMGRARQLDSAQEKKLGELLMAGALAAGYPTDRWTLRRIGKVILDRFGIEYSTGHVWHVLDRMGFSRQILEKCTIQDEGAKPGYWKQNPWASLNKGELGTSQGRH